jgi:hypothetical protein
MGIGRGGLGWRRFVGGFSGFGRVKLHYLWRERRSRGGGRCLGAGGHVVSYLHVMTE